MENFEIRNRKISSLYFDLAIDRVEENDMYMAAFFLKKSLIYNKKNIDSRNLLGLIYYKLGDIVEALVQWIISKSYRERDNLATVYMNEVQNDNTTQDKYNAIKLYNLALDNIHIGRNDLAMMQLIKGLNLNPNHFKSLALLSLLQLNIKDYIKAGSNLLRAQKLDSGNFQVNKLMNYTMANTKKSEVKEKKLKNVYSIKKLEEDDAILSKRYIKLTTNQKIIFILLGLSIGIMSYQTIVLPMMGNRFKSEATNDIIKYADLVNEQNKTLRDLTIENAQLKSDYDSASIRLKAYEEQNRLFTSQYETLNEIITLFDEGYISRAARAYIELDKDSITDETLLILLNNAKSRIEGIGATRLTELGTESWNAGNKTQAIAYYQLSLSINPNDPETMFLLARLYQSLGRNADANPLFDKVIAEHPNSNYSKRSREARGY